MTPALLLRYARYQKVEVEERRRQQDEVSWMRGYYVLRAIGACFSKEAKYPESPCLYDNPRKSQDDEEEKATDVDVFMAFAKAFNKENAGRFASRKGQETS